MGYYCSNSDSCGWNIVPRKSHRKFDFDHWAALARDNPEGFEELRRHRVDEIIQQSAPQQRQRLRGIQFRIDMERRRSGTAMGACVRIQSLMWDSVLGPDGFYERLLGFAGRHKAATQTVTAASKIAPASPPCAKIIPFPTPKNSLSE